MANPWDNDPIIQKGQTQRPIATENPWDDDPIVQQDNVVGLPKTTQNPWDTDPIVDPSQPIQQSTQATQQRPEDVSFFKGVVESGKQA